MALLTAFTSNANKTCWRSGDTWYLVALDLSWMGSDTKELPRLHICTRFTRTRRDDTHKQLVGHDDGPVLRVHVELHDVSVPAAIQQLVICEAQMLCWGKREISEALRSEEVPVTPTEQLGSTGRGCSLEAEAASPGGLSEGH